MLALRGFAMRNPSTSLRSNKTANTRRKLSPQANSVTNHLPQLRSNDTLKNKRVPRMDRSSDLSNESCRETSEGVDSFSGDDAQSAQAAPVLYLGTVFAISGALIGFLLAGYVTLSVVTFTNLFLGILIGWHSRGLAA